MQTFLPKHRLILELTFALLGFFPSLLHGQGPLEDYQRAEKLKNQLKNKLYNAPHPIKGQIEF